MITPIIGPVLALAPAHQPQWETHDRFAGESDDYSVDYLTPPEGAVIEVGGMDFLPDGRLVLSTRRGQVWIVEDPLAEDPTRARFQLFAEGLHEGLGLEVVEDRIFAIQRGELSRLVDVDADGRVDRIDTIASSWGVSGNYHEFAFGLPVDDDGNFYVGLNVAFFEPKWWHGKSTVPYRGWVLRIAPDGTTTPVASGFRSPCGLGRNIEGDIFITDNQGDWLPAGPIFHLQPGRFYGHPASLDWTEEYRASQTLASDTVPPDRERAPAAVWLPYKWSRSAGNLVADDTGGAFGPFGGQLFVAELTNGMIVRTQLEKVRGEYQGACFLFRQGIGSAARVRFAPDGTLLVGMTNRGWGGLPPGDGIARVRWNGQPLMEMREVHLDREGLEILLTLPMADDVQLSPANVALTQYDYNYWWEYGSPEQNMTEVEVTGVTLTPDRKSIFVSAPALRAGRVARLVLSGVRSRSGRPLLHDEFNYTVNQLVDGELSGEHVAKVVPPPPARATADEGWLRLTWGNAIDRWDYEGWMLCEAELDPDTPEHFKTSQGMGALVNASDQPSDYTSKQVFGDARVRLDFMLPKGGRSGVVLMDCYEIVLSDSPAQGELTTDDCGALAPGPGFDGFPPGVDAFRGPGLWHELDATLTAPRFDEAGNKTANAHLVRLLIDDVLVHEELDLPGPSGSAGSAEASAGPLRIRGDVGSVAIRDIRVRPLAEGEPEAEGGWELLFDEDRGLEGWTATEAGAWELDDDILVGSGARGHLFSPRGDYRDFELRARVKIGDGGNSGLYFRAQPDDVWPRGYEAQINSSYPDPQKTGGLYDLAPVYAHLVPPDTWFDYEIRCKDETDGTRIMILVNGIVFTDHLDTERLHGPGHIALQQHHDGSAVEIRELRIRELD